MNDMQNSRNGITYTELLLYTVCIYTIATLSSSLISFIPITRLLGIAIAIEVVLILSKGININALVPCGIGICVVLYSMFMASDLSRNINDAMWYIVTIFAITLATDPYFCDSLKTSMAENRGFIRFTIIVCDIILLVAILNPSCYNNNWGWGESEGYFVGFSQNGHTLASCCCLLIVFTMIYFKDQGMHLKEYIYYFPPVFAILFSGVRTFLISLVALLLINIFIKVKQKRVRLLVTVIVMAVFLIFLLNSSMMDKFLYTQTNQYADNIFDSLTNGRSEFWVADLKVYSEFGILGVLFGKGFDFIYDLNLSAVGIRIWAHNDVINNLVCTGIFGCLAYLVTWIAFCRNAISDFYHTKPDLAVKVLFVIYIWFPLLMNGMFAYQHYVFSCILLCVFLFDEQTEGNIELFRDGMIDDE